jgi:hypothetical protein
MATAEEEEEETQIIVTKERKSDSSNPFIQYNKKIKLWQKSTSHTQQTD